ncbi:aldo-keto reductase family 1 member C3-like [Oryctolagus cuniculus]|uniref:aldo-keto reductase family 1 member C3-like n=1 Tax=Oryctolagus cuniculus TaxID=9986 RepID=UPI003879A5E2
MDPKHQRAALNDGHSIPVLGLGTYAPDRHLWKNFLHNLFSQAMEKCKDAGLAKSIGVSNFNRRQSEMILNKPGLKYKPVCNQFRNLFSCDIYARFVSCSGFIRLLSCNNHLLLYFNFLGETLLDGAAVNRRTYWENKVAHRAEAKSRDRAAEAPGSARQCSKGSACYTDNSGETWDAQGSESTHRRWKGRVDQSYPVLLEDPVISALAKKHKRSPALIALRYQLQRGVVALAKSFIAKEIKENIQVFEFQLSSEDMKALDGPNKNLHYYPADIVAEHPNYPFSDEY